MLTWTIYWIVTSVPTVFTLRWVHSSSFPMPVRVASLAPLGGFLFLAWALIVAVLIDNCGAGGDCDPYTGFAGWPTPKAIFWASLPIAVAVIGTEAVLWLHRRSN